MKTTTKIKFTGPQLIAVSEIMETVNKVEELIVTLRWNLWGEVIVKIWKQGPVYKYLDKQDPRGVRSFASIKDLVWEYEFPKELEKYLEKL